MAFNIGIINEGQILIFSIKKLFGNVGYNLKLEYVDSLIWKHLLCLKFILMVGKILQISSELWEEKYLKYSWWIFWHFKNRLLFHKIMLLENVDDDLF